MITNIPPKVHLSQTTYWDNVFKAYKTAACLTSHHTFDRPGTHL